MKNHSTHGRKIASVVLAIAACAAAAVVVTGSGSAAGNASAAEYQYGAPVNTAAPTVSGTPEIGQTLTAANGTWTSTTPITYTYLWSSCDAQGANCASIAGATAQTYAVASGDIGRRLVVAVTAKNANGTTMAQSAPTAPAAYPTGKSIQAAVVTLPDRLVIDKVEYSANPIRSRLTPTQMRVHVSDAHGNAVAGSLVYVVGVPYSRIGVMPEVNTDASGWATLSLKADRFFPRTGYLVLFVRARVTGQDALGGTSTRRLVQVTIAAPSS